MVFELKDIKVRVAQFFIHLLFILFCVSIIAPLALTLIVSFSSEMSVMMYGYSFFPHEWSLDAYRWVLKDGSIFHAYLITIFVTVVGTFLSIILVSVTGYALSRNIKHKNKISMYFYLPTIMSFGAVAWYYNIAYTLHLSNTIWALIFPNLVSVWNIFLCRNYYKSIPVSLQESAEIDGATPWICFIKIMFPLALPMTATILLFTALGYWNDWYLATWFVDTGHSELYPLQYYLQKLSEKMNDITNLPTGMVEVPRETVYVATMFITMGPILLVYPFVQKYFIKGIMVGAVKG